MDRHCASDVALQSTARDVQKRISVDVIGKCFLTGSTRHSTQPHKAAKDTSLDLEYYTRLSEAPLCQTRLCCVLKGPGTHNPVLQVIE